MIKNNIKYEKKCYCGKEYTSKYSTCSENCKTKKCPCGKEYTSRHSTCSENCQPKIYFEKSDEKDIDKSIKESALVNYFKRNKKTNKKKNKKIYSNETPKKLFPCYEDDNLNNSMSLKSDSSNKNNDESLSSSLYVKISLISKVTSYKKEVIISALNAAIDRGAVYNASNHHTNEKIRFANNNGDLVSKEAGLIGKIILNFLKISFSQLGWI